MKTCPHIHEWIVAISHTKPCRPATILRHRHAHWSPTSCGDDDGALRVRKGPVVTFSGARRRTGERGVGEWRYTLCGRDPCARFPIVRTTMTWGNEAAIQYFLLQSRHRETLSSESRGVKNTGNEKRN